MTATLNLHTLTHALSHEGRCDHDAGCDRTPTAVMLSASRPNMWHPGAPAASLALLCAEHLDAEPVAHREHAEENARWVGGCENVWAALLAAYPQPIPLTKEN